MIKIETHCHSLGGSPCASASSEQLIENYINAGYKGVVLTNHYCKSCYTEIDGTTHAQKMSYYLSLRDDLVKKAQNLDFKVFTGAEVRAVTPLNTFAEFMIYGFEDKFLYDNPPLFTLTQKELFSLAEDNGLFMYQTHPFRQSVITGDPRYIHGAEAFNGHFHHLNCNEFATKFCESNNLIKLSGTDYHDYNQLITAGIYIPKEIDTNAKLVEFIKKGEITLIEDKQGYANGYKSLHAKG